ncbi:MAG: MotA/TolQ/ExbB proton channel family protein [Elainellaceae cyanobacterium]
MLSFKFLAQGGPVMVLLLALSILSVVLILERLFFWAKVVGRQDQFIREFLTFYMRDRSKAFGLLKENPQFPIARIFSAALTLKQPTIEEFHLALESAAQSELPLLRRFGTIFATIISVSPLLGLLGTVLGLIGSFSALQLGDLGGSDTTGVTAGISEALISTAFGLAIAIMTLMFSNAFRGLYLRQITSIQEFTGQLELLYRRSHLQ